MKWADWWWVFTRAGLVCSSFGVVVSVIAVVGGESLAAVGLVLNALAIPFWLWLGTRRWL